ncbi:MAG: hypothetical protein HOE80_03570 [Candidatus Magasanikbacteria bacterium]|jgi:hypothetical protein|nr:hypothetical protein [Candidatus Magasanikbacteria bacterium]MBT4071775.1 hypothetical protein [Candidatus Magasanikbacteria bacterium]
MMWQDMVLMVVSIVFSVALFPQVYYGFKEKKGEIKYFTSIPTFIGLYVICGVYFSLGLFFSAVMAIMTGTLWFILFIQRWRYNKS